jgi:hypothetical protein
VKSWLRSLLKGLAPNPMFERVMHPEDFTRMGEVIDHVGPSGAIGKGSWMTIWVREMWAGRPHLVGYSEYGRTVLGNAGLRAMERMGNEQQRQA